MRTFALLLKYGIIPLSVGFTLAVIAAASVQVYLHKDRTAAWARSTADLMAGIRADGAYSTYLTVLSYDPVSQTVLAMVRSGAINQDVPQLLKLTDDFIIERRDAVVQDSVMVGTKPLVKANVDELKHNTRGLGILRLAADGTTIMTYLLIGDPFPRP